jgi:mono/diheme cytochrome c family protein
MRPFLLGFIIGIILLPLVAFCYVYFGYAPVATEAPPFPMERKITSIALKARIAKEAPKSTTVPVSEENLMAGAKVYAANCAVCHGLPDESETPTAKGMFPHPPQLFHGHGVTDDPPGETYWKVKNGIRLTGMPAYGPAFPDLQVWQVSLFLANTDKLPGAVTAYLRNAPH